MRFSSLLAWMSVGVLAASGVHLCGARDLTWSSTRFEYTAKPEEASVDAVFHFKNTETEGVMA